MKKNFDFFGLYYIYWILFFVVGKIIFIVYESEYTQALSIGEMLHALALGLRMDLSMASYIVLLIFVLRLIFFKNAKRFAKIIQPTTLFFIGLFSLIEVSNYELYYNWGFHIDTTPLQYIDTPGEMLASTELWLIVALLGLGAILFFAFRYLYNKFIDRFAQQLPAVEWRKSYLLIIILAFACISLRGGLGDGSMNTGMVYFSNKQIANNLGINPIWNLIYSINKYKELNATVDVMDDDEANQIVKEMTHTSQSFCHVLNQSRPNVLIFVLETFSAYGMPSLGGVEGAMVSMERYSHEGIFFRNLVANGNRTDKGLVAIFSGYPAQPLNSIIKFPHKSCKLPFFSKKLKDVGYNLSFNYGGDIDFTNIRSYVLNAGFEKIIDIDDFPINLRQAEWGVHDEFLLDSVLYEINHCRRPFFMATLTLSSHPPYDVPTTSQFRSSERSDMYLNSLHYADSCLGAFLDKAKQQSWWDSTLIVLVADHSTALPYSFEDNDARKYRIPMIWTGGAVAVKDTAIDVKISQVDISKSLLAQLGIENDEFVYSKNIFADTISGFGFYSFNNGFGFVKDSMSYVWDQNSQKQLRRIGLITEQDSIQGFALWQSFNSDFVRR